MEAFKEFFRALGDGEKVAKLKEIYAGIRSSLSDLPAPGTKEAMTTALREYETNHPGECLPIPSEDQFYGVSKGANRLAKYIQWIHVPAVKDAVTEQVEGKNTALGKILARTVRAQVNFAERIKAIREKAQKEYGDLLQENQTILECVQ